MKIRRLNILVLDKHVTKSRAIMEKAGFLPKDKAPLSIPLSPDGTGPATHWYCTINVMERAYNQIMAMQKYSIIEEGEIKDFLKKHKLKRVR